MLRTLIEYRETEFRQIFGQTPTRADVMLRLRDERTTDCTEMHVTVCADYVCEDGKIELTTIEIRRLRRNDWVLQYLSEPASATGITRRIIPNDADFLAYLPNRRVNAQQPLRPFSAEALNTDGLGPVDRLNLRLDPLLPRNVDLARFKALAEPS